MKVEFNVKYGKNVIEIPITEESKCAFTSDGLKDLFKSKVTIYNDIDADSVNPRRFERHVINMCQVYGGLVEKTNTTVRNVVNAQTVITKDVKRYKSPLEYKNTPIDQREDIYTVQIGDYIVFGEVDDIVETPQEYAQLQKKYKDNGMKITSVSPNVFGLDVDNISMTNA